MIPATHCEIEQIYLAAEMSGGRSFCITACQSGDGVTSIVTALAERYLLAGHKTLIIDFNTFKPAFKDIDMPVQSELNMLIKHSITHQLFTGLTVPNHPAAQLAYKDPSQLNRAIEQWLADYDRIICDTSPLLQINKGNIPAQVVANACDHTALVVMAGKTSTSQVNKAMQLLQNPRIALLGSVLNLKNQASLAQEMVRELNRLQFLPQGWRDKWAQNILHNPLLTQIA